VRKTALIPLLLLALVFAACGCGGGGSSSSGTSSGAGSSEEAAWAKEVQAVMSNFENNVSAQAVEAINTTSAQGLREPLYLSYSIKLAQLADELESTKAPAACVAARKKIATAGHRYAELTKELGEQDKLSQNQFSLLVEQQAVKIGKVGHELTTLTATPTC